LTPATPTILFDGTADMAADLVRELVQLDGAEVARRRPDEDLRTAVSRSGASVVVVQADGDDIPRECRELLRERAALKVVGVGRQGRSAIVSWLSPELDHICNVSAQRLLAEVRSGA
jgi:hypothetical protein